MAPYASPAALRTALEARLGNEAAQKGIRIDRLRRRAAFERLLVRLEAACPGMWVLKGGTALEIRWLERARTTKDLDLVLRDAPDDGEMLRDLLIAQLARDPDRDGFQFQVEPPRTLGEDALGRPAWRFVVHARLAGREFAPIRVDVVARAQEIAATERVELPGALAFAGFPRRAVEVVAPAQHFAEKLHALTRRYPDRLNTRSRDLVDLLMILESDPPDPREALRVSRWVFDARSTHELPTEIPDPPASWSTTYSMLASELLVRASTVAEAMAVLRAYWETARATDAADGSPRDDQTFSDGPGSRG